MSCMYLDQLIERRKELLETIANCADEISRIDKQMPILYSLELEQDLEQANVKALV